MEDIIREKKAYRNRMMNLIKRNESLFFIHFSIACIIFILSSTVILPYFSIICIVFVIETSLLFTYAKFIWKEKIQLKEIDYDLKNEMKEEGEKE